MLQTIIRLPHEVWGLPLLGWGWVLIAWMLVSGFLVFRLVREHGWDAESRGNLLVFGLIAAAIALVLPAMEEKDLNGLPLGLPIRGYGVMLALAFATAVGWAAYRARRMGVHPEVIYTLAFWLFACGILGARAFYVIQYWDEFARPTMMETLREIVQYTEGGLVVFGSLIGAAIGFSLFCWRRRIPPLALADVIAPTLLIGLAIGRVGCLLNGCCYGGVCEPSPLALHFPRGAPPYLHQMQQGVLLGVAWEPSVKGSYRVTRVEPDGLLAQRGVEVGQVLGDLRMETRPIFYHSRTEQADELAALSLKNLTTGDLYRWSRSQLPQQSGPTRPAQLLSSLNALLLAILLAAFYPFRPRDGAVITLAFALYSVSRYLLEIIRVDESGQWGTGLTISQWIGVGVMGSVVLLVIYMVLGPRQLAFPHASQTPGD